MYFPREWYSQPTSAEIREAAEAALERMRAGERIVHPVVIEGRKIARSWWGQAWCENLEGYADYESRLGRGRRYVRAGAVVDLRIARGKVDARVQGTRRTPYRVGVAIAPIDAARAADIAAKCSGARSIAALINGEIPDEVKAVLLARDGLFPSPREIELSCSCPDWASMCKHVAAALYGVAVRLDEDPLLFFELRGIDIGGFIDSVMADRVSAMLANADRPSPRVIDDADLGRLFGLET